MIVVVVFILLFATLCFEALWRLVVAALVWLPILFCSVAAMHWTASQHLADPLAPLYASLVSNLLARFLLELTLLAFRRRA